MSKESTETKVRRARNVASGLRKLFKPSDTVLVDGRGWPRDELIALFDSHVAALDARDARYREYLAAVAAERALARRTNATWLDLREAITVAKGTAALSKLGIEPRAKPGPKTVASKLAGVRKRAAKKRSS